ncbi:MAG: ABC transporter permease [Candidatus Aenigmarchaeota archaeon]|nr:ABC transporter permease [Candidatus Aenigmarchaeota archaeon]
MHRDLFKYVLVNLQKRQLRSWLTILGIIIGIMSIVTLVSIAQGLDSAVRSELEMFGSDMLIIMPASGGGMDFGRMMQSSGMLTMNDLEDVRKTPGVDPDAITAMVYGSMRLSYRNENATSIISGVEPDKFAEIVSGMVQIEKGRFLKAGDSHVVVLANDIAYDFFNEEIGLDRKLIINGETYRVIGILKKSGSSIGGADTDIFIPIEDARRALGSGLAPRQVNAIYGKIIEGADMAEVTERIERALMNSHKVTEDNKDFSIITSETIGEQVGAILGLLTAFLGGVAAISLVVGGVGVANTMFMSVMERTREIGILKAVGARRSAIMEVFLMEAGLIGLIGGLTGVGLGFLISVGLNALAVPSNFTPELALFAISFSVAVGMVSGYFPARGAARMVAVEALRYE